MYIQPETNTKRPIFPVGLAARTCAEVAALTDGAQIWASFTNCLEAHGFQAVDYLCTQRHIAPTVTDPQGALFLSTHREDVARRFFESGQFVHAPGFDWARSNIGVRALLLPAEMANLANAPRDTRKTISTMERLGLTSGFVLSFPDGPRQEHAIMQIHAAEGVSQAEADAIWADAGQTLWALASMVHLRLSRMPLGGREQLLTARQTEVLEWVADGKTAQDIQVLTGLSISAVEKHLRRAREILMAETTAQAVAKAAFLNQLFMRPAA